MQNTRRYFLTSLFFLLILGLTACTTTKKTSDYPEFEEVLLTKEELFPQTVEWQTIEPGFEIIEHRIPSIKVSWSCVKIDLYTDPTITFYGAYEDISGKCITAKNLARKVNATVCINTTPFDSEKTNTPIGIIKSNNKVLSKPVEKYAATGHIIDDKGNYRWFILKNQKEELLENYPNVFGGFFQILEDGNVIEFKRTRRSRSGLGISNDGRYVYLFAATPDFSFTDLNGLNYEECAYIFKWLGCSDALQFDGGHSTGLFVKNKYVQKPFMQRKVPVLLGFGTNDIN